MFSDRVNIGFARTVTPVVSRPISNVFQLCAGLLCLAADPKGPCFSQRSDKARELEQIAIGVRNFGNAPLRFKRVYNQRFEKSPDHNGRTVLAVVLVANVNLLDNIFDVVVGIRK
jgi:hypothetical protein